MKSLKSYKFIIQGLDCAACAKRLEDTIAKQEKYQNVIVNFSTSTISFQTEESKEVEDNIRKIVKEQEPEAVLISNTSSTMKDVQRSKMDILRLAIGVALYFLTVLVSKASAEGTS